MRISEKQRYQITQARVNRARGTNADSLEKISTLKRINRLSDDPIGSGRAVRTKDRLNAIQQFQQNVEFSKGYLEKTESALQTISDNLIRAKELSVAMSNSTYDGGSRSATAKEVKQLINEVVQAANTTYADRYVFSGFRISTPALSNEGHFLGDDGAVFLQVEDGDFRQINLQSRYLFEATPTEQSQGHFDMLTALNMLHDGLETDDVDAIRIAMDELDNQIAKTSSHRATLGALFHALEAGGQKLEQDKDYTREVLANIEEVDMFKASSDFHQNETVLQSTLLASNKMLQPSLLNFMQ